MADLKPLGRPYCRRVTQRRKAHVRNGWIDWRHRRTDAKRVSAKAAKNRAWKRKKRQASRKVAAA